MLNNDGTPTTSEKTSAALIERGLQLPQDSASMSMPEPPANPRDAVLLAMNLAFKAAQEAERRVAETTVSQGLSD